MKCRFVVLTSVLVMVLSILPQRAAALGLEAAVGYWRQDPSGNIQFNGDQLDLEDDLGYDAEYKPFGRVKVDLPGLLPNIYLMATPLQFEETTTRNITFNFGSQSFAANVPYRSKLKLDHYDIALFYALPFVEKATLGKFNAELGLDVRIIDFDVEVTQDMTGTSAGESFILPVPLGYVGFQLKPIKWLALEGEVRGIAFSASHYVDVIGRLKIQPFGPFFVAGGYRFEDLKVDHQSVDASMTFQGPFVEIGVDL